MTDTKTDAAADASGAPRDYKDTLNLPKTDFAMRAGLPQREPEQIRAWDAMDLYGQMRARSKAEGRKPFVLHDGPPYANGAIHIGHCENKTLKDLVVRSRQLAGYDADYVPGWDCHGLPIEWKVEEDFRAKGKKKEDVPPVVFRKACRAYAGKWIPKQMEGFRRLGIEGNWAGHYSTMAFDAEASIAEQLFRVRDAGLVYRGSKPVMWSPVERTSLAEAEVEYHEKTSHTIWVRFPIIDGPDALKDASVVIWTTTPWTIPGNRAVAFNPKVAYGVYEVRSLEQGLDFTPWAVVGEKLILADALAEEVMKAAKVATFSRLGDADPSGLVCAHPLRGMASSFETASETPPQDEGAAYAFDVPLLAGDHVTDDSGTGFVHTAPGHGAEDFAVWIASGRSQKDIPFTVDAEGRYTAEAPGFVGLDVLQTEGKKAGQDGKANRAVIDALIASGGLLARGVLKHSYPHSWRSKAPVIFRATPQWFIAMDQPFTLDGETEPKSLRARALSEIDRVDWGQKRTGDQAGYNRIRSMVAERPDWLISRQRNWGVPIAVFVHRDTGEVLSDPAVDARILAAMKQGGADAWWEKDASEFLGEAYDPAVWEKVEDILDVWFDSGCTHAFTLGKPGGPPWPADVYLEGSDQHRGWFQSSLLVGCATRGRAPYDAVVTHGFLMDEQGRKMSKSAGNGVEPEDVFRQYGAEILRVAVAAADYPEDMRLGKTILDQAAESYKKLRNTLRYLLGALHHHSPDERVAYADMPELERWVLHRLHGLDRQVRKAYETYEFRAAFAPLVEFCNVDLSAVYFDIRKDALYCDPSSSVRRRAALTVMEALFDRLVTWLAVVLPFTAEEAYAHSPFRSVDSVHFLTFPDTPDAWRDEALGETWRKVLRVRRVVTGALEIERREKRIGSSLEAAPVVHVTDAELRAALAGVDLAEVAITSGARLTDAEAPVGAFRLPEVAGVAVVPAKAEGAKCRRSWIVFDPATADPRYPDVTPRDAEALAEWDQRHAG